MIHNILQHPNKLLRKRSRDVQVFDDGVLELVKSMEETVRSAEGSGMSAVQIGVPIRVVVINCLDGGSIVLVNPKLELAEGLVDATETCLSLSLSRPVKLPRAARIEISHLRGGARVRMRVWNNPVLAVAIQHEIDHLNGVLTTDRLSAISRNLPN